MDMVDPRLAVIAGVGAIIGSGRVRRVVGQGVGHAARAMMTVAGPIVRPVMHASQDIVQEARDTATGTGTEAVPKRRSVAKTAA
jgi:hypothetical protein